MHLAPLIRDLAIILGVAGLMTLLFQKIRQPVVLGYIIAGIIIGPYTPPFQLVKDIPSIQTWAELGVIFLMFTLGLEFSFRKLAQVGAPAAITASTEVLFFIPVGYGVGRLLDWTPMESLFLGAMLSISSTTIIVKALDELKLKKHRFAELIFGALIVEDLIAILLLVALGTVAATHSISAVALFASVLKLVLVVGSWFITGYFVVPSFMKYVGRIGNDEMLTILALGLCLTLVVLANHFNYSTALGAFIMGSIIAESSVLPRIERNMASIRDLFGAIFFVSIGMLIDPYVLWNHWQTIVILCGVTIFGKILSTSIGAAISGQSIKNSVQVGFGLAQIGEFSFIIAQLGISLKVINPEIYPIAVAVSLVTTFTTPYMIRFSTHAATLVEATLPLSVRDAMNRYASLTDTRRSNQSNDRNLPGNPLRLWFPYLINGLTSSIIYVASSSGLKPLILERIADQPYANPIAAALSWLVATAFSSPFIWAMFTAFRFSSIQHFRILSGLFTLFWIGALSATFFPEKYVLFAAPILLATLFFIFYRRLETSYHWFEQKFLSSFEINETKNSDGTTHFRHLAPWDAHLIKMEIHPNSVLVLKQISDAALRSRFGVNIIAIQRGRRSIVSPLPNETLLPKDELILLGTDEQIDKVRKEFEDFAEQTEQPANPSAPLLYLLKQITLTEHCSFTGQPIRNSGIREQFRAIVVGLERNGVRSINPDSGLKLQEGDTLWIAGEEKQLNALLATLVKT